jgi:CRP/FNR family cyclic AMP-dependent transcriptional regulator
MGRSNSGTLPDPMLFGLPARAAARGQLMKSYPGLKISLSLRHQLSLSGSSLPIRKLERNDFLYVQGEPGDTLFLIETGWLKRIVPTVSGRSPLIDVHRWGDLVGEASLSDGMRHDSIIAMSPCTVLVLYSKLLYRVLLAGDLISDWTVHMSERIRIQQDIISQFVTMDSRNRLAARLVMFGQRLELSGDGTVELPRQLTQEDLAAIVGTTRSRIGVFLRELEQDGLIRRSERGIEYEPNRLLANLLG